MDDSKRKGKQPETSSETTQQISDDQTPPASLRHRSSLPPRPPPSSTSPSSSSDPKSVQNVDAATSTTQETLSPSSSTRIPLSSIPPASRRPFFNPPSSGSPPTPPPQQSESSIATTAVAAATILPGSVFSYEQNLAAKLRLMKPAERVDFRQSGQTGTKTNRKKRKRETEAGRIRVKRFRPEPSPLGPDHTPYQKVQKCLTELKHFIATVVGPVRPDTSSAPLPTTSSSSKTIAASSSIGTSGCSSSGGDEEGEWTVEGVIELIEQFLKMVPETIGANEMENGLWEIQTRLGVDPSPSWYSLMCKSYMDMWESMSDYFDCETLDKSLQAILEEYQPGSGASEDGPSSPPSS